MIDVAGGGGGGRVRALFDFETSSADELSFLKGDVINVLERNWKEWWTGELRGRRGMFPIVYVVCFFFVFFLLSLFWCGLEAEIFVEFRRRFMSLLHLNYHLNNIKKIADQPQPQVEDQ